MSVHKPSKFVNLHSHTGKSAMDGLGDPEEHLQFSLDNGMDAMAITDHGNMNAFSHANIYEGKLHAKGRSFKYIPGVEAYYHPSLDNWRSAYAKAAAEQKEKKTSAAAKNQLENSNGETIAENEEETKDVSKWGNQITRRNHLVLLAKSSKGLTNLFTLVSRSYGEGFYKYPRIDAKMLKEHGEDIVASSACIGGPVAHAVFSQFPNKKFDDLVPDLLDDKEALAKVTTAIENEIDPLIDALGPENFFLELQYNKLAPQHLVNRAILHVAKKNGLQLVSTADSHYAKPELWQEREMYKLLGRMKFSDFDAGKLPQEKSMLKCELYPKNADQMWDAYKEYGAGYHFYDDEVVGRSMENSWHIAHDLIGKVEPDRSLKLPSGLTPDGLTPFQHLIELCKEGLKMRGRHRDQQYIDRTKMELGVIRDKKVAPYFIATKAIMDVAKEHMWTGIARGSGGGSLVNYLLGITDLDPVKYDLMFARFISHARSDLPDIDCDIADRDRLIDLLKDRFGQEKVVPISLFSTLQLKSLVKDISKFHSIPFEETNAMTAKLDFEVGPHLRKLDRLITTMNLDDALQYSPTFQSYIERHPSVLGPLKVLYRQQRSVGKHAGGVLVLDSPATSMPLISVSKKGSKTGEREFQTPWIEGQTAHHLEPFGFVKFDLLGLNTLNLFTRTAEHVLIRRVPACGECAIVSPFKERHILRQDDLVNDKKASELSDSELIEAFEFNPDVSKVYRYNNQPTWPNVKAWLMSHIHPDAISFDRPEVYKYVFHEGRFSGVFQYSEKGVQRMIKAIKPETIVDLASATAIYRPGPLGAKVDKLYIEAKNEGKLGQMDHPALKEVLGPTFGFCLAGDTYVHMSTGPKTVKELAESTLEPGTMILSYDETNRCAAWDEVVKAAHTGKKEVLEIETENGPLRLTADHKVLTTNGWKEASSLLPGDEIIRVEICGPDGCQTTRGKRCLFCARLKQKIAYAAARKQKPCRACGKTSKVLSVKSCGHQDVYDIETRNHHNFAANDGLIVHNCLFQEQVMSISQQLSEFSDVESDKFRKAITKKSAAPKEGEKKSETLVLKEKFLDGAVHNKYPLRKAEELYEKLEYFSRYGFNKSHAVAYSLTSYQCALLRHDYESEWLCAYIEDMISNPKKRSQAISEIKEAGYCIGDVDINVSGQRWGISADGKVFLPSMSSIKGIGVAAIAEAEQLRPYKNLEDLLWDDDGNWKHSKFNKSAMRLLVRTESLKSMDLVGPGRQFPNWKALEYVLVDNADDLRKKLKSDPERHHRLLKQYCSEAQSIPDWSTDEKIADRIELMGSFDATVVISQEAIDAIEEMGIPPISAMETSGAYWFVLTGVRVRTTKNGKEYLMLDTMGEMGIKKNIQVWAHAKDIGKLHINRVYCATVMECQYFGAKTTLKDLRLMGEG